MGLWIDTKSGYESQCKACRIQSARAYYESNYEKALEARRAYREANDERLRASRAANADAKKEYNRAYQAANVEKIRELKRAHRIAHAEEIREYNRAYYEAHRDEIRERIRKHRAANIETYFQRLKDWRAANPDKVREYTRLYYSTTMNKARYTNNPDIYAAGTHRRRAKRYGASGSFTVHQIRTMRKAQNGICLYCRFEHSPNQLTIDHIIPMSRGGSNDISNIGLACRRCNFSKNDKLLTEWIDRWYERDNGKDQHH